MPSSSNKILIYVYLLCILVLFLAVYFTLFNVCNYSYPFVLLSISVAYSVFVFKQVVILF